MDTDSLIDKLLRQPRLRPEVAEFIREAGPHHATFMHYARLGDAHRDASEWHQAYLRYRAALDILPLHSGYLVQAGHMLKELGRTVAAEGYYRSAVLVGSPMSEVGEHLLHVSHVNGFGETLTSLTGLIGEVASAAPAVLERPMLDDMRALVGMFAAADHVDLAELVDDMRKGLTFREVVEQITRRAPPASLVLTQRALAGGDRARGLADEVAFGVPTRDGHGGGGRSGERLPFWQRWSLKRPTASLTSDAGAQSAAPVAPRPPLREVRKMTSYAPNLIKPVRHEVSKDVGGMSRPPAPRPVKPTTMQPPPLNIQAWTSPWERRIPLLSAIGSRTIAASELSEAALEMCRTALAAAPQSVSVVMPTWNRAHVVCRAIDSVISQSYPAHELVVVDDGSTDGTCDLIEEKYAEQIKRGWLILIRNEHGGISRTRNAGLKRVTGKLVAYLDSDNHWDDHFLMVMAAAFAQCAALGSAYCAEHINDIDKGTDSVLGVGYQRENLLRRNFIDLNCFVHRRGIIAQQGQFDEGMTRLVDWDLIIRYTTYHPPAFVPVSLVEYFLDKKRLQNVTHTERWDDNFRRVAAKYRRQRASFGIDPLRIAYVIWDWPALSQTFVLNELRWLVSHGFDVQVYYKTDPDLAAELDFPITARKIDTADELAAALTADKRTVLHSPFAYPGTALLTWPAARATEIPFTFMPGGVDISHHVNRGRNRVAEVAADELCSGVITLGTYHERLLEECGVPRAKLIPERQAVGLPDGKARPFEHDRRPRIISIGRFIEKKGFKYLVEAAAELPEADFILYGYGPLDGELRQQIEQLELTNVQLAGTLDGTQALHEAYYAADLFALPCVEAINGDMDGLPTVIIEAMAAGVPVVTSRLANIPDLITDGAHGLLVPPKDVPALVAAIRKVVSMPAGERARLIALARERASGYASTDRMMRTMVDTWRGRSIDIVLVTYDTPKYDDWETTREIVDRIYAHTTMPFHLIVVDNNSQASFRERMRERYGSRANFTFVESKTNLFCGPGTNLGIDAGSSQYIVYICSKEGFVLRNGWEWEMVRHMDAHPNAAMGGYLISMPGYRNGAEYATYASFPKWRNQQFARDNPDRRFQHVQGGFYILRRDAYRAVGGFSDEVVQDGTDIEYSYYLESAGWELVDIPGIYAISSKTLPAPHTLLDDQLLAIHPLRLPEVAGYARVTGHGTRHCNACGWHGEAMAADATSGDPLCPECASTPFDRSVMRFLSLSGVLQRRPIVTMIGASHALAVANKRVCPQFATLTLDGGNIRLLVDQAITRKSAIIIIEPVDWAEHGPVDELAAQLAVYVAAGGRIVVGAGRPASRDGRDLAQALRNADVAVADIAYASNANAFDTRPVCAAGFPVTRGVRRDPSSGRIGTSTQHLNL